MVDKAVASMAKTIQSGAREGIAAVVSLPARLLSMLAAIITFPFRLVEKGFSGLGRTGENIIAAMSSAVHTVAALPGIIVRAAMRQLERVGRSISERTSDTIARIGAAISASFIGPVIHSIAKASRSVISELSRVTEPVRHVISASGKAVGASLSKISGKVTYVVASARTCVNATIAVGSRIAGNATFRLSSFCSQCGTVVKSLVIALAAKSDHSQEVALEVMHRLGAQCGTLVASLALKSEHAQTVTLALLQSLGDQTSTFVKSFATKSEQIVEDVGASLAVAGARVSSSIAAAASWCLKLFRRDDKSDSASAASL